MINKELLKSLSRCCLLRHPCTAMTNGAEMSNAQLGKILPLSRTSPRLNNLGEHHCKKVKAAFLCINRDVSQRVLVRFEEPNTGIFSKQVGTTSLYHKSKG